MTNEELEAIEALVSIRHALGASQDMLDYLAWQESLRALADMVPGLVDEVKRLQTENDDLREGYTRESAGAEALRGKVAVMDRLLNEPRYSTEDVEALLVACDAVNLNTWGTDAICCGFGPVLDAMEAVRASREPAK